MQDIFKSIKAYLYDRTTSPLLGAYITAWSIWNYRIFVIIFTGKNNTPESKFEAIDTLFKSFDITLGGYVVPVNGTILNGLLIPAIITFSYLYIYPRLAKPVYEHSLEKQKELREIKQKEQDNRLLSVEESREIYRKLSAMEVEHESDVENYTRQISGLSQTISELEKQLSSKIEKEDSLRRTQMSFANYVDPEGYDDLIRDKVESFQGDKFQLSDLFDIEQWNIMDSSLKQAIGKRLKQKVDQGGFVGVSAGRKGSGNQQIYTKENNSPENNMNIKLSLEEEEVLRVFSGLKEGLGNTPESISNKLGIHKDASRMHLDDLTEAGYINYAGETGDDERLYRLQPEGRRYLVKNNLLPN